ncbi:Hypothetical protein A7982_09080 [Minicystis rosea]|nr:Hypothetical protein A7982_09080 [Minicystis rosea]
MDDDEETNLSPWCELEDEYRRYLDRERHLFAWCLRELGGMTPAEAEREALLAYEYQPATHPNRGLVFHDIAWHWAMLRIHGGMYWLNDRTLERPSEAYHAEAARYDREHPETG